MGDVLIYGNKLLRRKATAVAAVTDEVRRLAHSMLKTMYDSDGLGLAAAQIGRPEALCVIDIPPMRDEETGEPTHENQDVRMPLVLINPVITERDGHQVGSEGCLSFPGVFVSIKRAESVAVSFLNMENEPQVVRATGLLSRAIQHELDHLDGVLLVDRMSTVQKVAVAGKLKKLRKGA
ncbi:MAG: peptide deformylase [Lentisphaerae bacterium]|nr:peptide deformylase [Lentisphaerota bacterium]